MPWPPWCTWWRNVVGALAPCLPLVPWGPFPPNRWFVHRSPIAHSGSAQGHHFRQSISPPRGFVHNPSWCPPTNSAPFPAFWCTKWCTKLVVHVVPPSRDLGAPSLPLVRRGERSRRGAHEIICPPFLWPFLCESPASMPPLCKGILNAAPIHAPLHPPRGSWCTKCPQSRRMPIQDVHQLASPCTALHLGWGPLLAHARTRLESRTQIPHSHRTAQRNHPHGAQRNPAQARMVPARSRTKCPHDLPPCTIPHTESWPESWPAREYHCTRTKAAQRRWMPAQKLDCAPMPPPARTRWCNIPHLSAHRTISKCRTSLKCTHIRTFAQE